MQTIHFTLQDLARIRLGEHCSATVETHFAINLLHGGGPAVFAKWRDQVRDRLRALGPPARPRASPSGSGAAQPPLGLDGRLAGHLDLPGPPTDSALRAAWRVLVAPYWTTITGHLATVRDYRGRDATAGGVERLLSGLHPAIRWRPPVLEILTEQTGTVVLSGAGLQIRPAVFLADRPALFLEEAQDAAGPNAPTLIVASPPDPALAGLWDPCRQDGDGSLGALLGHTRAAALKELTTSRTTVELAERLGISSAGASQHASVLRRSGLITTRRVRNTARHTVTPLGMALLGSRSAG
jgi:DNA-binding transcriptional ArsR family regulator